MSKDALFLMQYLFQTHINSRNIPQSGGIWKAVESSVAMGGHAFALFLGSQRSWTRPVLDSKAAVKFQQACAEHGFSPMHILPHGSYLMNCGSPKEGLSTDCTFCGCVHPPKN